MKRCPECGQTYNDGSLNFCLMDGAPLADTDSEPTVVLAQSESSVPTVAAVPSTSSYRQPVPPTVPIGVARSDKQRKRGKLLLWAGLVVLIIFLAAIGSIAWLIYDSSRNEKVRVNSPGNGASPALPKRSLTPRASPSPATTVSTPQEDFTGAKNENVPTDESDEITPISWTTAATGFKNDV
jgi:hypothetical protein